MASTASPLVARLLRRGLLPCLPTSAATFVGRLTSTFNTFLKSVNSRFFAGRWLAHHWGSSGTTRILRKFSWEMLVRCPWAEHLGPSPSSSSRRFCCSLLAESLL